MSAFAGILKNPVVFICGIGFPLFLVVVMFFGLVCSPNRYEDPDPVQTKPTLQVKSSPMGTLNVLTVGLRVSDIETYEGKTGEVKLAYLAVGDGTWAIDLSSLDGKYNPEQRIVDGKLVVDVYLPEPSVTHTRVDFHHPDTGIVDIANNTLWKLNDKLRERLTLRAEDNSQKGMAAAARNKTYGETAKQQAERVITGFYLSAGADDVRIHWGKSAPNAPQEMRPASSSLI